MSPPDISMRSPSSFQFSSPDKDCVEYKKFYAVCMSLDGRQRLERIKERVLPLADSRVQVALAMYVYKKEHPEKKSVANKEVMSDWLREHADGWRRVIDAHPDETISLDDETAFERYYDEMSPDSTSNTRPDTMH